MQELWFLFSACRLMLNIYMKFHGDRLNSFQVIERTRFCEEYKGNNSKSINARVMVFALCISSNVD